ncbi:FAD-dependent monooxygenase [Nocardia sp. NPDC003963]
MSVDAAHPASPVLIVGAGPSGMTLAIELRRRNIPCRIIDAADGPLKTSRSFTVHSQTLLQLQQLGIATDFLREGLESYSMDYHFLDHSESAQLDFRALGGRFPYILILNQNRTEAILRDHLASLGVTVEWGTRLVDLSVDPTGSVTTTLAHDNAVEVLAYDWVVGCDGVRSTVRRLIGAEYAGSDYTGTTMRMMDLPIHNLPLGDSSIHYLIGKNRMVLVTRLPSDNYRLLISDKGDTPESSLTVEAFQAVMDQHFRGVTLGKPNWGSQFDVRHRLSDLYIKGNVVLCGDAAHIHSPAGGMGMNCCVQDAFNLGWKLAWVINGTAKKSLIETYPDERRPVDSQVKEGADLLHQVILAHGDSINDRMSIVRAPGFNQTAVGRISGRSYSYRDVVSTPSGVEKSTGLRAGDSALDIMVNQDVAARDLFAHPGYTLMYLPRTRPEREVSTLAERITRRYGAHVRNAVVIPPSAGAARYPGAIFADSNDVHQHYGFGELDGLVLVRPDGYVAARCLMRDQDDVFASLSEVLA